VSGLAVMAERGHSASLPPRAAASARVCVGRIAGAHGVRGDVRIASYTEDPFDIASYGPVSDEEGARRFALKPLSMAKTHVVARIEGIGDRNGAEALKGVELYVPRDALPDADDGEFYWEDLVGLRAETTGGDALGMVLSVQDFGAGEVLEVGESRRDAVFVPFTQEIVPTVDLDAGRVVIDPVPGLFEAADDVEEGAEQEGGQ